MYSSPKILASLETAFVLTQAEGWVSSSQCEV